MLPGQTRQTDDDQLPSRRPAPYTVVALLACVVVACRDPGDPTRPLRLVDRDDAGRAHVVELGGDQMRVLDPQRNEHVFAIDDPPARPELVFAVGVPGPGPAVVRFEIEVRSWTTVERVYQRDVADIGWTSASVDLAALELRGHELVLRKTLVDGPPGALSGAAWGNPTLLPAGTAPAPAVILVSLDTLRADRVRCYGDRTAPPTPALDELARTGVRYQEAYAPATWTLPSHRALFAGRRPPASARTNAHGSDAPAVLADILRRAGYLTAGFTGGGFLSHEYGFATGFDEYYEFRAPPETGAPACTAGRFDGPEVFRRAIAWLERHGRFPSFLFVHTYDAHDRCPFVELPARIMRTFKLADRERIVEHYGRVVQQVDGLVGSLVEAIERAGLASTTMLVVTSDHGEGLWEHGFPGHGPDLKPYEELARVPLFVRFPGRAPAGLSVAGAVSLIDVAPTILRALGMASPPAMQGRTLPGFGFEDGRGDVPVYVDGGDMLAVRMGQRILITSRRTGPPDEVYDLAKDSTQRSNLGLTPESAPLKEHALEYWRQGAVAARGPDGVAGEGQQVTPQVRERLRALGYLE